MMSITYSMLLCNECYMFLYTEADMVCCMRYNLQIDPHLRYQNTSTAHVYMNFCGGKQTSSHVNL